MKSRRGFFSALAIPFGASAIPVTKKKEPGFRPKIGYLCDRCGWHTFSIGLKSNDIGGETGIACSNPECSQFRKVFERPGAESLKHIGKITYPFPEYPQFPVFERKR